MAVSTTADRLYPGQIRQIGLDLARHIVLLPRLSVVFERFVEHTGRDTASARDIASAMDLDPVLRTWVLRQANSGFCNLRRPIRTSAEACVVLGIANVTRLLYAACTRDLLNRRLKCYRYRSNGFWLHGLAVGLAARRLAGLLNEATPLDPGDALVAGLLHDAGKLLLDEHLPRSPGPRLVDPAEEVACTGLDHAVLSAAIADAWSLSMEVVLAVALHHASDPPPQARLVAASNLLMKHWEVGSRIHPKLQREPPLAELLDLTAPLAAGQPMIERWCRELPPLVAGLADMVKAVGHGRPPNLAPAKEHPEQIVAHRLTGAARRHRFSRRRSLRGKTTRRRWRRG